MVSFNTIFNHKFEFSFRSVTSSAYGPALKKMLCNGFVKHPDTIKGQATILEEDWLKDENAQYAINIAGNMVRSEITDPSRN